MAGSGAASPITSVEVAPEHFGLWGVSVKDYQIDGVQVDFETIVVGIAAGRATTIEREVQPLAVQVTARNRKLQKLSAALGDLTRIQVSFEPNQPGNHLSSSPALQATVDIVNMIEKGLFDSGSQKSEDRNKITKANVEKALQLLKGEIDKLNNESQTDTTRLQSYVSKRDEAFNMASTILSAVSETRAGAIRAMGS